MKHILSVAAVSLAFAVSVGAQATPPSQTQPPSSSSTAQKSSKAHKKTASSSTVTLTGCVRQGADPNSFELDNVQMSSSSTASSTGTGSSTSASSATGSGTSTGMSAGTTGAMEKVTLMSTGDIDLKPHVGHRVEVRGTMTGGSMKEKDKGSATSDTMGSGSSASSSSATGTSGGAKGQEGQAHALRVRSLRHISDTCS